MTPCARSHTIPGEHTPPCTCTRECPDHEGHCAGCLPVEAVHGLLCSTCSRRLRGFLGAEEGLDPDHPVHGLPWAWEHLQHAYPSLSQAPGKGGSSVDDPEAERLAAVVSLRDDIRDVLGEWVKAVCDSATPPLGGPDLTVNLPAHPYTDGRLDRVMAEAQRVRVRRLASWLLTHVESLESHEAVTEAWQELADLMSRAHALAPWRPAPTRLEGIPCRCGAKALYDHSDEIKCWHCGYAMDREQYRVLTTVYARRFADDPRAVAAVARPRMATLAEPAPVSHGGRA